MRNFVIILLCVFSSVGFAQSWPLSGSVYVSNGCEAYAYHKKKGCASLKECNAQGHVSKTTRSKAINDDRRTPCGRCLKKEYKLWKKNKWLVRKNNSTSRKGQSSAIIKYYKAQK